MTITYHSQNRKELVRAISEIIGIPAVYQFMPTCAYKIGECYHTIARIARVYSTQSFDLIFCRFSRLLSPPFRVNMGTTERETDRKYQNGGIIS